MTAANYLDWAGLRVVSCSLMIPFFGVWSADVVLETDVPAPAAGVLSIGDLTLVGVVAWQDPYGGQRSARLVGGAGGWRKAVLPRAYQNPGGVPAALVLSDAALEVGEKLVGAPPVPVVGPAFVREGGPASRVLEQVLGGAWWVDAQGVTHAEPRVPAPIATPFDVINYDGATRRLEAAPELLGQWLPGAIAASPELPSARLLASVSICSDDDGVLRVSALTEAVQ